MKALKDFQDERLTYHYDFASTAEMYAWIQMVLNDGKQAECHNSEGFKGNLGDGFVTIS